MADATDGIDIMSLSDDQIRHMLSGGVVAPAPQAAPPAAPQIAQAAPPAAAGDSGIDIRTLSDAQIRAMMAGQVIPKADETMSWPEAAARSFYKHLTFGTEPFADKKLSETAAREHPYVDMAAGIPAVIAQTMALGPIAGAAKGVQGASMLAKAARGAGTAIETAMLPNMEARGLMEVTRTGAKLGGNTSALEALGSGLTNPDKTLGETAKDTALSYGIGTVAGAGLGAGTYGLTKAAGAVANRTMPHLSEALEASRTPEGQAIREIIKRAGWDGVDMNQFARLKADLDRAVAGDTRLAAKFQDLNLLEALKAGELKTLPTGELKPGVVTTRNLDDLAKHWANTEGRGQNIAADAFANRKNEMSSRMQADIDQSFGSGNRAADEAVNAANKKAAAKPYQKLRDSNELLSVDNLKIGTLQQQFPEFAAAMEYAGKQDAVRNFGSGWQSSWSKGKLSDTVVTMSPSNLLDIHHYLVMQAKPKVGGDPASEMMYGNLKRLFSGVVDDALKGHKGAREGWSNIRRVMEAADMASDLPIGGGGPNHPSMVWLRQQVSKLREAENDVLKAQTRLALAARDGEPSSAINTYRGQVTKAQNEAASHRDVVEEFQKLRGEKYKNELQARGENGPAQLTRQLTTEAEKKRILEQLGPERGKAFIEALYNKANQQRLGNTLYGGSDTAFKQQKRDNIDALWRMASGLAHFRPSEVWKGAGDMLVSGYRQRGADLGNELMSRQGPAEVSKILESLLATQALKQTAVPFVQSPLLVGGPRAFPVDPGQQRRAKERASSGGR